MSNNQRDSDPRHGERLKVAGILLIAAALLMFVLGRYAIHSWVSR